ncbi:unnamed protein product [Symbiodinium natans]|uniref:Uncharacterized protein n=1 Tax=Symbiodinium natans TaxID=878477 RepID=A0A812S177_9DINO|nr:unnamed protein product [Symbiodinium natans]
MAGVLPQAYIPVLIASPETVPAFPTTVKMWQGAIVSYLFKRVIPLQRRWLLLKTFPEAICSIALLALDNSVFAVEHYKTSEGTWMFNLTFNFPKGASFVVCVNLLIPCIVFVATWLLYEPLRSAFWNTNNLNPRKDVSQPVMESDLKMSYMGHVDSERDVCVVSFPGKYTKAWELCIGGRHRMSVACVFLLNEEDGYGRHSDTCMCKELYGERGAADFGYYKQLNDKDHKKAAEALEEFNNEENKRRPSWGCKWFEEWTKNVEKAVAQQQTLVVYYFRGQVGQGEVDWADLGEVDLWDKVGLGGSQKGEVAWLKKNGYDFVRRDVADLYEVLDEFWA